MDRLRLVRERYWISVAWEAMDVAKIEASFSA
jgi:hypothetical protein